MCYSAYADPQAEWGLSCCFLLIGFVSLGQRLPCWTLQPSNIWILQCVKLGGKTNKVEQFYSLRWLYPHPCGRLVVWGSKYSWSICMLSGMWSGHSRLNCCELKRRPPMKAAVELSLRQSCHSTKTRIFDH